MQIERERETDKQTDRQTEGQQCVCKPLRRYSCPPV